MPPPTIKALTQVVRDLDEAWVSQRIMKLTVTPQPNAVRLDFTTNVPTIPVVEIFRLVRDEQGKLVFHTADSVGVLFDFLDAALGNLFTEHHARVDGLAQESAFSYRITAGDGPRRAAVATGTFKTGRRTAAVVIREIQIWNDGDPGLKGDGELEFAFALYDRTGSRVASRNFRQDISSGEIVSLPFGTAPVFHMQNATDSVAVYTQGYESDGFGPGAIAPPKLPEAPTHGEDDYSVVADAFQQLELPNDLGVQRVNFSLDSGPQGIFFIITGWIDVQVTNPPPMFVRSFATGSYHASTTLLRKVGARSTVYTPGGHVHVFGLGPDGVIAHQLPRVPRRRRREWALIPTGGAESATIIAQDERHADIVTVSDGSVRVTRRVLGGTTHEPSEWTVIGEDMQPTLTALRLDDHTTVLVGLARAGEVRATLLRGDRSREGRWAQLGGHFVGRVAALAADDGVELFAVTSSGEVQHTNWRADSEDHRYWKLLGAESVTHVFAVADEAGKHLVALTRERVLLALARERTGWSKRWQVLGTLDDLEKEERTLEPAPSRPDCAQPMGA